MVSRRGLSFGSVYRIFRIGFPDISNRSLNISGQSPKLSYQSLKYLYQSRNISYQSLKYFDSISVVHLSSSL